MAPPLFSDLGKPSRDVFNRGYNFGFIKLNSKLRSDDAMIKAEYSRNIDNGNEYGGLSGKCKFPSKGVTVINRYNSDNKLSMEVVVDRLINGLKLGLVVGSANVPFNRFGKIKSQFMHDNFAVNADLEMDSTNGPIFTTAGVIRYKNWFVGCQTILDLPQLKMTNSNFALAFDKGDFGLHALVKNATEFSGNLYHRMNSKLEIACNLNWTTGQQQTRFGTAAKYEIDRDTVIRCKINQDSQLGLGLTHSLVPGLKITVSTLLNLRTFSQGGHKYGFGLECEFPADCKQPQQKP